MPAVIVLLGLIFLIAGVGALVVHLLKRRTDRQFAVIEVTRDRRSIDLRKRGDTLDRIRADAVLERWVASQMAADERERAARRERLTQVIGDAEVIDIFRRQAN